MPHGRVLMARHIIVLITLRFLKGGMTSAPTLKCCLNSTWQTSTRITMQVEAVQLQWQVEHCWHRPKRAAHRLQRHEDYAHDESIHWKILKAIDSSWKDDVEHQTQENTNKLHKVMIQHKHRPGDGAKEPYIDEEIWSLRRHKILIKQKCTEIRTRLSRNALVTCFDGWKKKVPSENRAAESQYDTTLLCHAVSAQARLFITCETMRRVLRRGKQQALQEQLKLITEKSSASEVLQKLKAFVGPTNPKKAKRQQLPCVKDVNGIPCRLPSEALDIWIAFVFQSMEGGTRLQLSSYDTYGVKSSGTLLKMSSQVIFRPCRR